MELNQEEEKKVNRVIEKMARGNPAVKDSPSTKVMAINLLISFNWDVEKALDSLG